MGELRSAGFHVSNEAREIADHFAERFESLSPQRQEILRMRACGETTKHIAELTFLSYQTIKNHLYHSYKKIGLVSSPRGCNIALVTYLLGRYDERRLAARNGGSDGTHTERERAHNPTDPNRRLAGSSEYRVRATRQDAGG